MSLLTDDQFATLKLYCKIDQDFDDDVLKNLVDSTGLEIARAIQADSTPATFISDPRFLIALMKQVKEDYYQRGITADNYRPELTNSIADIVNQLRSEVDDSEDG
ncbi:head-tail connector protein [Ligilactobacillus acidipiscis]|uniref:Phage protein n=1 Tax=Ligilactobacillus acidipiscis TaxID=89059 RepID=A0A0R2KFL8_9LACO|nr:head-tail connector protein [Ligilactobacillus acidipiscis]KRN88195.1 phage protein [Ligilactobacillus acidipiscis]